MGDATQRFKHNHGLIQNQSTARSHTRTPFRSGSEPHYLRMVKHRLFWAKWPFLTICLMGFNLHFGENHSNAGQNFPRQTFPVKATTFHHSARLQHVHWEGRLMLVLAVLCRLVWDVPRAVQPCLTPLFLLGGFNHLETILKHMSLSDWEGWHPIYETENKVHVWNHQPAINISFHIKWCPRSIAKLVYNSNDYGLWHL